ncbi:hypothetical protein P170DRAFT_506004 [Aspergillus steynii IBT 23096]|uniref:Uncharacterized protein n=1 Tax=Aspergillus steynii IBT 23096 TaxID=1392250 RepID=A0A2I2GRB1_9EURO|nr:uncharacterized protein P170DRAFT_506004 [Aspergillus steynii IBT 23096]PLB55401.1 hypothetical protein P170DRAFT_506004 [Aspergillus steynii IBT 23096]
MAADSGPKSLRDILLNYTSFLVTPLQWTSRHLELVGCRFEDVATTTPVQPNQQSDQGDNDARSLCLKSPRNAELLATNLFPAIKRHSLTNILVSETRMFARLSNGKPLYFQGRPVHQPVYIVFHRRETPANHVENRPPTLVGYLHYTSVNGARRRQFEPCPGPMGAMNSVGARICQKRLHQTTPKEWTEDPYFVCHLLALAQSQEHTLGFPRRIAFTSRLLVTNVLDRENLFLYEADITAELLAGLRNPRDATRPIEWPVVRRKRIPYQPYKSFSDRLVAELLAPSSLPSYTSNLSQKVNDVIDRGQKRTRELEDSRPCKARRT